MADADTLEAAPPAAADPDIEARARVQGWRPKDEYRGPAERWRPADEFLRAAETVLPVAVERNRLFERKLDAVNSELAGVKQVLSEFREFASRGEQRAYERAKAELVAKRDVAVAHADTETFKQVDREISELDKSIPARVEPRREAAPPPAPENHPAIVTWRSENPWFDRDRILHNLAKGLDEEFQSAHPGLDIAERLGMVKAEVQRRYPEKFANPAREGTNQVSQPNGGNAPRKTPKHSYENLPPDAKKACDKFVKTISGFKVEDYVRDYDWADS